MTQPTPTEIALLHNKQQRTELYLSIYKPKVVFAAQINDVAIQPGADIITFDNVTTGAYTDIRPWMTMYIGSTPGGTNYGRIRVRGMAATTITVAANSDINWKNDLYLTVKDFYEVWPRRQVLQAVGNTPATDEILVFKDTNIQYVAQNDHPGSLIWMGSNKAAWLETGSVQLYWSATGTVNTEGASMTYAWVFEGGTPSSSSDVTPGLVTYNAPGHYVTQLIVTSSSGVGDISYRYVSIYDATHPPIIDWGMDTIKGSRNEGAYTTSIWVRQPVDSIVEGALVVIFSKSYYGATPYSFVNNIEFVGYILNDSISYDYQQSKVEFEVGSVTEVMKAGEVQGISLTSILNPANWSEMGNLTILKTIWWFLRWHSTILCLADVRYIGANFFLYAFEPDPSSLYDALAGFMQSRLLGTIASNRQGQIICEVDPETIHNATTAIPLGMKIDRMDWMGTPDIREATRPGVSYLEMGGYVYNQGTSGTNTPYLACAPGNTPSYFGKIEEEQEVILSSGQAYLNTLVGDVFAYRNARYPEIIFSMAGNYGNIEFIPTERYLLTVEAKDSQSRMIINNLPIHPVELTWKYVPEKSFFYVDSTFHELTDGLISGTSMDIPQSPIQNVIDIPPYEPPPFVPGTGTPWPGPWIPPPIGGDNCFSYFASANGPYLTYPDITTLNNANPSAYVYFPCKTRCALAQNPSYITIYYSALDDIADHILTVDILDGGGIVPGGHMTPGAGTSVNDQSVQYVHSLPYIADYIHGLSITGFRLNLNPVTTGPAKNYDISLGDLTFTGMGTAYTGYSGDSVVSVSWNSFNYGSWSWDWQCQFRESGGGYTNESGDHGVGGPWGPVSGLYNSIFQPRAASILGGSVGPITMHGVVLHCYGTHYPSGEEINLKQVFIGNVCPQ